VWSAFGRLEQLTDARGGRHEYAYDALGRRVGKIAVDSSGEAGQVPCTWFLWDGDAMVGELRQMPAGLRTGAQWLAGSPQWWQARQGQDAGQSREVVHEARFYVYHPESFEPLAMQVRGPVVDGPSDAAVERAAAAELYYYQNDPNGMPVRLRDGEGSVVWEVHYGVTGGVDHVETRRVDQPLRLQGQYCDEESGLHYNRYRYYDPGTGSFISQDPIGLAGGENPYEFAPNAFTWIDPLGLKGRKTVFRYLSAEDLESLKKGLGLKVKGCSGSITDHVDGKETNHISASGTKAAAGIFNSGNGLAEIDVDAAIKGGASFVDHKNVMNAVERSGSLTNRRDARRALEVLFKGDIPRDAIINLDQLIL
jgi:RHS repeat-associated protein